MVKNYNDKMAPAERERRVWKASREYSRGEITAQDFEDAERQYTPDYKLAVSGLSQAYGEARSKNQSKAEF